MQNIVEELKDKTMENYYEIHRSEAITILLGVIKHPQLASNIMLAECLEIYFPDKKRTYIVKEDDLVLGENQLTAKTF